MVLRGNKRGEHFLQMTALGAENRTVLDKLCAVLLAIAPILQHYVGVYKNAGFTALLVVFPIVTLRFIFKFSSGIVHRKCLSAIFPLLIFELYSVAMPSFSINRLLYGTFMIWVFFCVACGCVNISYVVRCAAAVACIAALLLVAQYISYYLFSHHIQLVPTEMLLLPDGERWIKRSINGVSKAGSMYRPSAFFLEPSHLFLYTFPVLGLSLLLPDMTVWRLRQAVLLTAGIVLSTSGMGIAVAIGFWGLYLTMYWDKRRHNTFSLNSLFSSRTIVIAVLIVLVLVSAYLFVPIFQSSVNRIFVNDSGSTAIEGRVRRATNYIRKIKGSAVLFGSKGGTSGLDFNRAGFFATYIKTGLIGVTLTYWFYGQGLARLRGAYFWLTFIILVISFFTAHTHGTFYMLYFVLFLLDGYYERPPAYSHQRTAYE